MTHWEIVAVGEDLKSVNVTVLVNNPEYSTCSGVVHVVMENEGSYDGIIATCVLHVCTYLLERHKSSFLLLERSNRHHSKGMTVEHTSPVLSPTADEIVENAKNLKRDLIR